jgi:hypothetical protein
MIVLHRTSGLKGKKMNQAGFTRRFVPIVLMAGLVGLALPALPAVASPSSPDSPVVLKSSSASSFATVDGSNLRVITDATAAGERVVTAKSSASEPAKIVIQSVPRSLKIPSQQELSRQVTLSPDTVENPGLIKTTPIVAPISTNPADWVPSSSYAVTRTTATFTWERATSAFQV